MLYIVLVLCCGCVLLWWCWWWWWCIVGLCWRQYVAMSADQFVKIRNFCATGARRTKFCATSKCRKKNQITQSKILCDMLPSHQILCYCLFVAQKIRSHNLKFCATGSRRTKFCATAYLWHKKSYYTKFRLFFGGHNLGISIFYV